MKLILTPDNMLPYYPSRTQNSYEMLCRLKRHNTEDITIKSTLFMAPVANHGDDYILFIDRKNITINNNDSLTMLEQLALACSACLFPMHIVVNQKGEFVSIYNYKQIVEYWEALKHKLHQMYDGEVAHRYINKNNKTIQNKELLYYAVKNDFFFYCYFKPLYIKYTHKLDTIEKWNTVSFLEVDTPIEMNQKVFYDSTVNSIRINATNIAATDEKNTTTISLQYTLNPQYNTINTIAGIIIKELGQINIDIKATKRNIH